MNDGETAEFDSALRMIDFNLRNPDVFKNNAKMTGGFASLKKDTGALTDSGAHGVSAGGQRSGGTADADTAKKELVRLLRKAANTGVLIKKEEPDFNNEFKLPRGALSTQQLVATTRAFINKLTEPIIEKFGEYGVSVITIENLTEKLNAYEAGHTRQNAGKGAGVAATAETKATIKRLRQTRRTTAKIGDNILEELGDEGLQAEWKSVCRVRKTGSSKPGTPDTPPDTQ